MEYLNQIKDFFNKNYELFVSLINKVDWVNSIAGAIIGVMLLPTIYNTLKWILLLFYDKNKVYYGTYFLYGYYLLQKPKGKNVNEVTIEVKKPFIGKHPIVKWFDGKFKYKGYMRIYDNNIYIHVTGITHKEEQLFIVRNTLIPEQLNIKLGLKVAINNNGDPAASYNLLSNSKLDKEQVQQILGSNRNIKVTKDQTYTVLAGIVNPETLLPQH